MVTEELGYACRCRGLRRQWHDCSVGRRDLRRDGTAMLDELLSAE